MSISLKKDPAKRLGGWALLRLPAGSAGSTTVAVRRADTGEWLGGADWQGARHGFGPYPVETGPNGPFVRIGPEIVNRMEAYLPLAFSLSEIGLEGEASWPENIPPAPEGHGGGGVGAAPAASLGGKRAGAGGGAMVPPPVEPAPQPVQPPVEPEPQPSVEPPPPPTSPPDPTTGDGKKKSGAPFLALLLALLVAAGALGWYFTLGPGAGSPTEIVEEETAPPVEQAAIVEREPAPQCVRDEVAGVLQADDATAEDFRTYAEICRSAGDADLEVRLLERLANDGDAEALKRFAVFYDPRDAEAPRPFGPADAANAASYYKQAIEAGSTTADAALQGLCTYLRGADTTEARMVTMIHCQ